MSSDPLIGTTVGGCLILEVIGQGGMGIIYKARQRSLDRVVALKVLAPNLAKDVNFVGRFQREARAIARINHPNILAVYDVGDDQNTHYMIMELIDGKNLAEMQTEMHGLISWQDAANFVSQAAHGLEAAQAAGIIHRDIKPENLLITKKGVVKVSDFGLAKEANTGHTTTDAVMGTPAFMSPEQCDGKKVDARSDIYSLGGTFYRMITGRLPFEAETAMSMMYRHKHEALIPPHEVVPELPHSISKVVMKMLSKKREQRYQTMADVIKAIGESLHPVSFKSTSAIETPSAGSPATEELSSVPAGVGAPESQDSVEARKSESSANLRAEDSSSSLAFVSQGTPGPSRATSGSGRSPRQAQQEDGNASDSSSRMNMPSSILGIVPMGLSAPIDGYANVSKGDELLSRGDRIAGLKFYKVALQAKNIDNATRSRIELEFNKEVTGRRQAAENLIKRGLLVEASRECRILADLDPSDESARGLLKELDSKLALKRTLVNDIRTSIAGSLFEKAISLWDNSPSDLRDESLGKQIEQLRTVVVPSFKLAEQGEEFSRQGRLEEAISSFEDALKTSAACESARLGLKDAEQKLQRIDHLLKEGYQFSLDQEYVKAVDTWRPILALRPGHPQAIKSIVGACLAHAQNLRAHGNLDGSLAACRMALDADPDNRTIQLATEDLSHLCDKEQALIERANDAAARGRWSEASGYWKEVQRLNPHSKSASTQILQLKKQFSGSALKNIVVVSVVLSIGILAWQYFRENQILADAVKAHRGNSYQKVLELLNPHLYFYRDKQVKMLAEANFYLRIEHAKALENDNMTEAADEYEDLSMNSLASKDQAKELAGRSNFCKVQLLRKLAHTALASRNWKEARDHLKELSTSLQINPLPPTQPMADLERETDETGQFVKSILKGLDAEKSGNKRIALDEYQSAQKLLATLMLPDCTAFIEERLEKLNFNPKLFQELFDKGMAALKKTPPELDAAKSAFLEAAQNNPADRLVPFYLQYVVDLAACDKDGMSLYAVRSPIKGNAWGNQERSVAFCIDRYEWPNQSGAMPKNKVTWIEAHNYCQDVGKQLCESQNWTDGCKGGDGFTTQYPYGNTPDNTSCNTDSLELMPSGSKPLCKNSLGVYDMSGNLAEWINTVPDLPEAMVMGGAYDTPASNGATCNDFQLQTKMFGSIQIGFRCCRPLPKLQE